MFKKNQQRAKAMTGKKTPIDALPGDLLFFARVTNLMHGLGLCPWLGADNIRETRFVMKGWHPDILWGTVDKGRGVWGGGGSVLIVVVGVRCGRRGPSFRSTSSIASKPYPPTTPSFWNSKDDHHKRRRPTPPPTHPQGPKG